LHRGKALHLKKGLRQRPVFSMHLILGAFWGFSWHAPCVKKRMKTEGEILCREIETQVALHSWNSVIQALEDICIERFEAYADAGQDELAEQWRSRASALQQMNEGEVTFDLEFFCA